MTFRASKFSTLILFLKEEKKKGDKSEEARSLRIKACKSKHLHSQIKNSNKAL